MKIPNLLVLGLSVCTFLSTVLPATAQLSSGLLNYWPLDGDAEDTAVDFPPNSNTTTDTGTINGAVTFEPGRAGFGSHGVFPGGAGNNITVADPSGGTDDIDRTGADVSVSVWFQLTTRDNNWQALISHGEGADYRVALRGGNTPIQLAYAGGGASSDIFTPSSIEEGDGVWHHIVATTEGSTTNLYLNGILEVSGGTGAIGPSGADNGILCIGCNPDNGREWNGLIDDIGMWDRAITADEVKAIYDAGVAGSALSTLFDTGDDDGDGLPNAYEIAFGLDPNDDGLDGMGNPIPGNPNGEVGDPDGDGVENIDERANGTFPNDADSDDDLLSDGVETNTGTFVDATNTGTDPLNADTDGDTLQDGAEDNGGTFVSVTMTGSDPHTDQSDSDTMPDGYEVDNMLDPNVDDSALDPDTDNVTNITEFTNGTDPQLPDTDMDGYNDDVETNTGAFTSLSDTGTDPLNNDTDGDSLLDGMEDNGGVFISDMQRGTNPHVTDTDGDSTHDGAEVAGGRDPLDPSDAITSGFGQKLVAYWDFDNNLTDKAHTLSGESMVADDGVFNNGPGAAIDYAATGFLGTSALQLDGSNGWVTVASSVDTLRHIDNAATVSAWFQVGAFDAPWQAVVSHGEGSQYRIARSNNTNMLAWAGGAGDITSSVEVADGEWHHAVAISDPVSASTSLYIDGVSVATGDAPTITAIGTPTIPDIPDLLIGANPQAGNREWSGQIDDVAIWGRALTEDEITEIYNGGTGATIASLLSGAGDDFRITNITFNEASGDLAITWNSTPGETYRIDFTTDLSGWGDNITDGIEAAVGEETTTHNFTRADIFGQTSAPRVFFRVQLDE